MIFAKESVEAILAGRKVVTRRLANGPCKYRVGSAYSVQPGRGKREVARILVHSIRREPLHHVVDPGELDSEGFDDLPAFRELWKKLHGDFEPTRQVDRIEFGRVG